MKETNSSAATVIAAVPAKVMPVRALLLVAVIAAVALGGFAFVKLKEVRDLRGQLETLKSAHTGEVRELPASLDPVKIEPADAAVKVEPPQDLAPEKAAEIPLRIDISAKILAAIRKMVPNLEIVRYEQALRDGVAWHTATGKIGDADYEIKLNADAEIIEAELPPAQMPASIRKAADDKARGVEIVRLRYELDNNRRQLYRADGKTGEGIYDFVFTGDGELLKMRIPAVNIPQPIREAALRAIPELAITYGRIYSNEDPLRYKIVGSANKHEYEIEIGANADLHKIEMPIEALPKPIRKAMKESMPGIQLVKSAEQNIRNGNAYETKGWVGDNRFSIRVLNEGKIVRIDAAPVDPPKGRPQKEGKPLPDAAPDQF